jgi:hypothetical protein
MDITWLCLCACFFGISYCSYSLTLQLPIEEPTKEVTAMTDMNRQTQSGISHGLVKKFHFVRWPTLYKEIFRVGKSTITQR